MLSMEIRSRNYDKVIAAVEDRNAVEAAQALVELSAELTGASNVRLRTIHQVEDVLIKELPGRFNSLYDYSIAHSLAVPSLDGAETALHVSLSPSFSGEHIPSRLSSNGAVFVAVEPGMALHPEVKAKYEKQMGTSAWQYLYNEAAGKKNRAAAGRRSTHYYHNNPHGSARVVEHTGSYAIESAGVGVYLQTGNLRRLIEGLDPVYQTELGEWLEVYPVPVENLPEPVQTISTNGDMDAVFERLDLYHRGVGAAAWNYSKPRFLRGVLLRAQAATGETSRLG